MHDRSRFFCACVLGALTLAGSGGVLAGEDWDFDPPRTTLQFHFWHHSTGEGWLANGLRDALELVTWNDAGTPRRSYLVTDYGYGGQNDFTDWRHWYKRFRFELGVPAAGGRNYVFHRPQVPANEIAASNFMLTAYAYTRQYGDVMAAPERMDVVMFKPCFPGSVLWSYDTRFDARHRVIGGTPWSDSNHLYTNYDWLDSTASVDEGYTNQYWPVKPGTPNSGGEWYASSASLAQVKAEYRGLLGVFRQHPEVLFIAVQAPPQVDLTPENTAASRELARWFREDWLHEWDPTGTDAFQDYVDTSGHVNVRCFDYYDVLAYTADDAVLDAKYSWFGDGWSWPDEFNDWTAPERFVQPGLGTDVPLTDASEPDNVPMPPSRTVGQSRKMDGDSHPSSAQQYHATDVFVGGKRNPASRGYRSWINAMTNRWLGADVISLTLARLAPTRARLTWSSKPGATYAVHAGATLAGMATVATVPSAGTTTTWTDENASGSLRYYEVVKP